MYIHIHMLIYDIMKKTDYVGIDIGGTHISCGLISETGKISGAIHKVAVDCNAASSDILYVWQSAINKVLENQDSIAGIGLAIPGPFNYEEGISLIKDVKKLDSLFGLNIKEAIRAGLIDKHIPMTFINDASSFALGEVYSGSAIGSKRTLVITLGTGLGSAFLIDGNIQTEATCGIPQDGYLYNVPFGKSNADDYFSTRWFVNEWLKKTGVKISGVKEIARYAEQNDRLALEVFEQFSYNLVDFLMPWIQDFKPDTLIIGGNITKASNFFLQQLRDRINTQCVYQVEVKSCELWDKAPLIGAAIHAKLSNIMEKQEVRKTHQLLAPQKAKHTRPGYYDIYPGFPIGTGKINEGYKSLSKWIIQHKTVVIDGYIGVFWNKFIENINYELIKQGKKAHWYHIDAAMKSTDEIDIMLKSDLGEKDSIFGKITNKKLIDWFDKNKIDSFQPNVSVDINILIGCGASLAGWNAPLIYIDLPKNELQFRMRAGAAFNLGTYKQEDFREMYKRLYFVDWRVLNEHKANILPKIDIIVDEQRLDCYLWMTGNDLREGLTAMSNNFFRVRPWFEPGAWGGSWLKEHLDGINKDIDNLAWSYELMVLENGLMFESDDYRLEVSFDFLMYNNYKEVLGDCAERFKYDFPIRFDLLDTFDGGNLSVQCHPNTEYIQQEFGMPFTQDETYYILDRKNDSGVYLGFQENIDSEKFHSELLNSEKTSQKIDIEKYVQYFPAKKHDFFLIPNGTIHASGKDNLVLEISSAPYIFTFKMYDWVRMDLDGRPRPINIEHGMKNVNFECKGKKVKDKLISKPYMLEINENYTLEHLQTHSLHFYDVHRYTFDNEISIETHSKCHVWMLVEGFSVILETKNGMQQHFNYAETFVIPANARSYKIINTGKEKAMMLKAFVK